MNRPSLGFHIPAKTVLGTGCDVGVGGDGILTILQDSHRECGKYQKGSTGRFGVAATFAEDNRRMGSGVIYYEIEKREKYEDFDKRADSDLAIVKTQSVRFNTDRPYELPIESLLALRHRDPSKGKDPSPQRSGPSRRASPTPQYSPLSPKGRDRSRVGNSFPHPRDGCAEAKRLRSRKEMRVPPQELRKLRGLRKKIRMKKKKRKRGGSRGGPLRGRDACCTSCYGHGCRRGLLTVLGGASSSSRVLFVHSSQAFAQNPSDDARSPSSDESAQL
ncbi:hypothetical protein PIB30_068221 [Stylosanthes scabra]|uniref:Uncharacterized protein n=1 Tax=Stylosanthes scabra TaxID=79078 RepID=A0ABU6VR55_9FABA|nr:hypothetical protein [Stylosanthes scabra]